MKTFMPSRRFVAKLLVSGLLAATASAATDKSGVIEDETWTPAMSPIRVIGDISVYSLTIQPGVEVLFTGDFEFDCPGVLTAAGNAANKIWFHGDTEVTWKGINFLNSADGSVLNWCIVENSNDHGIAVTNSLPAISNCVINNNTAASMGGGVYIRVEIGRVIPSLTNCTIANNWAGAYGGGLYASLDASGEFILSGCEITNNTTGNHNPTEGGGLWILTNSPETVARLVDCYLIDNKSEGGVVEARGGGAFFSGTGKAEMLRCRVLGNRVTGYAAYGGGGVCTQAMLLTLRNCDFQGNVAQGLNSPYGSLAFAGALFAYGDLAVYNCCIRESNVYGGGVANACAIYIGSEATVSIKNSTIVNNTTVGIRVGGGTLTVCNSILYFNNSNGAQVEGAATITYSDVQNGYTGTGNINLSPLFRADGTVPSPWPWPLPVPTSWPWPSRLSGSSPCKDAGNPDPVYNDLCFYDATTTPWGSLGTARNDMGAYGGPGACLWEPGSVSLMVLAPTGGGLVGVGDNVTLTVQASGIGPFTYVWKKGDTVITDIPGHITGANSATLAITGATATDAGNYTVEVTNALGDKLTSAVAAVAVDPLRANVKMFAGIILQAAPGKTVRIEYSNNLSSGSWTTLTQLVLPSSPYTYYDADSPNHPKRFYRAVEVP